MLQLLDDGRVTDSKGDVVNFCNTIVIFTSNIGSQDIIDLQDSNEIGVQDTIRRRVEKAMKDNFKPEFLNRVDEYVIFNMICCSSQKQVAPTLAPRTGSKYFTLELYQFILTINNN